ncbi:hypothetical protein CALVIDRAFT_229781 [Calocera viscosa TUFC12733]|uniref:Uncharacterized protein n=1 Tax=Calocera viscosa (strain TUFC12733) TaxID=1330018 RepID=A0A167JW56_CALVF|nr:hypothetical protein CALVIDRAFT_229781 [Calocera viscosa TUFC12733]
MPYRVDRPAALDRKQERRTHALLQFSCSRKMCQSDSTVGETLYARFPGRMPTAARVEDQQQESRPARRCVPWRERCWPPASSISQAAPVYAVYRLFGRCTFPVRMTVGRPSRKSVAIAYRVHRRQFRTISTKRHRFRIGLRMMSLSACSPWFQQSRITGTIAARCVVRAERRSVPPFVAYRVSSRPSNPCTICSTVTARDDSAHRNVSLARMALAEYILWAPQMRDPSRRAARRYARRCAQRSAFLARTRRIARRA